MSSYSSVRPSPIAGSWYPSDPALLKREIEGYIKHAAVPSLPGEVMGLIAPHAGYYYSGKTAGYAYSCIQGSSYDLCAVFSPMHDYYPYNFLTSTHDAYATPFGQIGVAQDLVALCSEKVQQQTGELLQHVSNDREHSLEIQLPFLQMALESPFLLLPIMVRTLDPKMLKKAAGAIAEVLQGKNVLLVASTDLSHFYIEKTAKNYDSEMLQQISSFSPAGVLEAEQMGRGFACGAGAVALVLWVCQLLGAKAVTVLNHSTSADASGDSSRVVGYGSAAVTR